MPHDDAPRPLQRSDVPAVVAGATFPDRGPRPDEVGIEAEFFPIATRRTGGSERVPLDRVRDIAVDWATSAGRLRAQDPEEDAGLTLDDRTRLTFEPGGQIEVSGACTPGPSAAAQQLDAVAAGLASAFDREDVTLVSVGFDAWHDVRAVPQQLRAARYPAMAAYLARRSAAGATMMRHTCSLQVNLDAGTGALRDERWLVANLAAPLAVASFATSPEVPNGAVSRRAQAWAQLDPTRTGFPPALVAGEPDPVVQLTDAAMRADVLLVRRDGTAYAGTPGWTFAAWLEHGHPRYGRPTADDLRYHLTTLFHEVRPRGALEMRSIDALPARWRIVPAVLYAGLLYDDRARQQVLGVLADTRPALPRLLARAADVGIADPSLCATAVEAWSYAIEGARRLAVVDGADVRRAEAFVDRFTMRGRCPGDELRELLVVDRGAARAWASEPIPTATRC